MKAEDLPRWAYRFDNYRRAHALLGEALDLAEERALSALEREGVIRRFDYCWRLAWALLADDLTAEGLAPDPRTPATIRVAAKAGLIDAPDVWMAALEARDKLARVYDFAVFERVIADLRTRFRPLFDGLYERHAPWRLAL